MRCREEIGLLLNKIGTGHFMVFCASLNRKPGLVVCLESSHICFALSWSVHEWKKPVSGFSHCLRVNSFGDLQGLAAHAQAMIRS